MSKDMGNGVTLADLIVAELSKMLGVGVAEEKRSSYFSLDFLHRASWIVRMAGSSGVFGTPATVVDTTTGSPVAAKAILADEAVMRDSRILAVLPPSEKVFAAAFEVQGNGSLMTHFARALDKALRTHNLKLQGEHDVADGVGWRNYLQRDDVEITGVDLVQRGDHVDGAFVEPAGVRNVRLSLGIDPAGPKARDIFRLLRGYGAGAHINVAAMVGVDGRDFDEQTIKTVQDGRNRTINVSSGWPRFVYSIHDHLRPSGADFEAASRDVLEEILAVNGVTRTPGWWAVGRWS
ncbi:hypothetical protein [Sinomonas susongensis]|uniref:hypothetical protein n=1 Tax=Sinomonas susongensis TaxID=1324851 RepID=UPI0011088F85|nr:hypothetical protein [Sinomonas susongensis]